MRSQWAIPIQSHLHTSFLNLYGSHKSWRRSQCTKITRIRRIHGPLAGPDWPKHCTTCSMWHVTMGSEGGHRAHEGIQRISVLRLPVENRTFHTKFSMLATGTGCSLPVPVDLNSNTRSFVPVSVLFHDRA